MAAANKVTLGPEAEAAEAEVGVGTLGNTAPQVEADGRERILRADGDNIVECRVLGIKVLDLLLTQHLGFNRLLLPLQILMGVKR